MSEPTDPPENPPDGDETDDSDEPQHLKFNRDVLPDFKRRPEVWEDGKKKDLRDDVETLAETDSIFKWVGIAIFLIAIATIVGISLRKGKDDVEETNQIQLSAAEIYERDKKMVSDLAKEYLATTTLPDRLGLVRRTNIVQPFMEAYYSENEIYGLKVLNEEKAEPRWSIGGRPFWDVVVNTPEGKEMLIIEQDGQDFKVDWETHVGLNPMSPEDYVADRPTEAMEFRVFVTPDDYFNGAFSDKDKYLVAKIGFPNSNQVVFGYIDTTTPEISRFRELVDGKRDVKLFLKLQWPEETAENALPQVHIRELVMDRWLLE